MIIGYELHEKIIRKNGKRKIMGGDKEKGSKLIDLRREKKIEIIMKKLKFTTNFAKGAFH